MPFLALRKAFPPLNSRGAGQQLRLLTAAADWMALQCYNNWVRRSSKPGMPSTKP